MTHREVHELALACGFDLAGVTPAAPVADRARYHAWTDAGYAGEMRYLTDRRATLRDDPRYLLPSAQSVIVVAKLYNTPLPYSTAFDEHERAWISRYAWGRDYHDVVHQGLEKLELMLRERSGVKFESKICVDSAPLLERSYARLAGLGWIGKNTCLINERIGSWFFLGELLVSLAVSGTEAGAPPPDRCGTCRRCIDTCPTMAIVPRGRGYTVDARRCISYLTIELRRSIPEDLRPGMGGNVFGCDICQDVCPWNQTAPFTTEPGFDPEYFAPPLEKLAALSEEEFQQMYRGAPVTRARYLGFLRNVAVAMGNRRLEQFRAPLEALAESADPLVAEHARWGLKQLG